MTVSATHSPAQGDKIKTFQQVQEVMGGVIQKIYKKSIGALPQEQRLDSGFTLLAAVGIGGETRLFRIGDTRVEPVYGFACAGIGAYLATYVAEGLYSPDMPLSRAIILASYIVYVAKEHVPGCGKTTSIITLSKSQATFDWDQEIYACEGYFHSFDSSIKSLFLTCADTETPDASFDQRVEEFVQSLQRMREHKKRYPDLDTLHYSEDLE